MLFRLVRLHLQCNDLTRASCRVSYSNIHYGCTKYIIIPTIQHSTLLTITHTTQTTTLSYFIILHGSMHRHYHCLHHHTSLHYYCSQRVLVSHSQIITIQFPAFSTRKKSTSISLSSTQVKKFLFSEKGTSSELSLPTLLFFLCSFVCVMMLGLMWWRGRRRTETIHFLIHKNLLPMAWPAISFIWLQYSIIHLYDSFFIYIFTRFQTDAQDISSLWSILPIYIRLIWNNCRK